MICARRARVDALTMIVLDQSGAKHEHTETLATSYVVMSNASCWHIFTLAPSARKT
jgi:hypothetical protein